MASETSNRWEIENTELQSELQSRIRSFPSKFDWDVAADMLSEAQRYGLSKRSKYSDSSVLDWLGRSVDVSGLTRAIENARVKEQSWRNKAPLFGKAFIYEKGINSEWLQLYNDVTKVYIESAGVVGQRVVKDEAKEELVEDLKDRATFAGISLVVVVVVVVGGIFLFEFIKARRNG